MYIVEVSWYPNPGGSPVDFKYDEFGSFIRIQRCLHCNKSRKPLVIIDISISRGKQKNYSVDIQVLWYRLLYHISLRQVKVNS